MRKIYVLDENGHLQEIDAGITKYKELQDSPITTAYKGIPLVGSTISIVNGDLHIEAMPDHKWTEEEVLLWCNSAPTGKYDIVSHAYGTEWLIVDYTNENTGGRFRRITPDQDWVYDTEAGWVTISDIGAKALIFKINNLADIPATIVVGNRLVLDCYYYSTVADGNITITKDGRTVAAAALKSGVITPIILTGDVTDGTNEFKYIVTNNGYNTLARQVVGTVGVKGIKLVYSPGFSANQIKSGNVSFPVDYSGTGTKYAYFRITDATGRVTEYKPDIKLINDNKITFTLSSEYFSHGENIIETYLYMKDGDTENILTQTDTLTYKFPYVTEKSEPIVMTYFDFSTLKEWDTINIPYRIWHADGQNMSSIKLDIECVQTGENGVLTTKYITQEYNNSREAYINNYLTPNSEHKWQISNLPHGMLTFRIYLNGTKDTETGDYIWTEDNLYYQQAGIYVEPSDYSFQTVDNYLFNFAANDIVDTKPFETWESNGYNLELSNFNWTTDGIKTEIDKSLKFTSAGRAELNSEIDLFAMAETDTGVSFEIDFKVDVNASSSDPIIRYGKWDSNKNAWADRFGLIIYPTRAVFNYDKTSAAQENLVVNYQKGERINLGITIEADAAETTNRYLKIFINGIISKVIHYTVATEFPSGLNKFQFNCSGSEFDLYGFRAYDRPLTSNEMLQNYISNFASTDTKINMLSENNIFSKNMITYNNGNDILNGEYLVSFEKTKGKIGCLVMIMDTLPETKDYLPCHTIYYEKDENHPQVEWDTKNNRSMATTYYYTDGVLNNTIKVGAQGTSSLEYPRKNFKFKFADKFYIKGHKDGKDKTITCKADYMDSSGANNITNAQIMENSIMKELWTGTPASIGARVNLDGFPICIFHAKYVDQDGIPYNMNGDVRTEPEYLGIFNFNYDKKPKALLGWEEYEDPQGNVHEFKFKGFEFRDNTSDICLQKGIANMLSFVNANIGFEYRWTYDSDWIDDFHDGHLDTTMDGGFFDNKVNQYNEADYLRLRFDPDFIDNQGREMAVVPPFNRFHVKDGDNQYQIYHKIGEDYKPVNYNNFGQGNDVWSLDFGVRLAERDGEAGMYWQPPYKAVWSATGNKWTGGARYDSGEGYYKFRRNPEHECKFEYNDVEPYFSDINYEENGEKVWRKLYNLSDLYARHITYTEAEGGEFVFDPVDKDYYHAENYTFYTKNEDDTYTENPNGTWVVSKYKSGKFSYKDTGGKRYSRTIEYIPVKLTDTLVIEDFMKKVFSNWYYCIDTLCHIKNTPDDFYTNYKPLIDSNLTYKDELGDNGNGLFILDSLLNYYCSSVTVALCDNFCKNMMIHSYDDGKTWSPAWYDMDTCFGLNNSGSYVFDYDCDFKDPSTFNGSGSKLWDGLYNMYMPEINAMYRKLRGTASNPSGQKLSYNKSMDIIYGENIKYKSEAMYNSSAFFRYIIPDLNGKSGTKLPAAQGNRLSLLRYWLSNRQTYLDSRYGSDDYSNDKIQLRMHAPKDINFTITPDTTMYLGFSFNQSDASMPAATSRSTKIKEGTTWTYTYNVNPTAPLQDLNTYIFGASHLTDIGDISVTVPKLVDIQSADKLKRLILGTDDPEILARHEEVTANQKLEITMPKNICKNMKEIDLHNLKYLDFGGGSTALSLVKQSGSVMTNLYPALEKIDIRGSNVNAVVIGEYTPLQYLGYSDNITTINLKNLPQLSTVEFGNISKVMSVSMINCNSLNQHNIIKLFVNMPITVVADNLQITEENAVTSEYMDWLMDINADISGHVFVQNIADSNLDKYREKWPNLIVDLYQIYADEVIFGVSGEGE